MSTPDPITRVQSFDAAWNAHELNEVIEFFANDAIVRLSPPPNGGIFSGKSQIRAWAEELLPGFHVDSANHCVTGDEITWRVRVSADKFRSLNVDPVEGTANARFLDDKFRSLTITFDSTTAARLQAA
jgi:hypothetical protein